MLRTVTRLWKSRSGLAAIEFGMIAPVLAVLLLGTLAICNLLACRQKVIALATNVSVLVSMVTSVTSNDISNAFNAGNAIMFPFPNANTKIVISSITYSAVTHLDTVAWSRAKNTTPLTQGSVFTPPAGVIAASDGASAILTSVAYDYTPPFGGFGPIHMTFYFYSRPRRSLSVACNGC